MKKSDDISQAFLLKQFPGRRKLSSSVPAEVSWRNSVLVATTALIIAILTSVILYKQTSASLQQERIARAFLEQRLLEMEKVVNHHQELNRHQALQAAEFAKELKEWEATAIKDEKSCLNRVIVILEKHSLTTMNQLLAPLSVEKVNPEMAQGLPPWEKAE